ncbi:MAG: DHHA1 domain-containing protein [Deinococcales bacterium]
MSHSPPTQHTLSHASHDPIIHQIAKILKDWSGPIHLAAHVDPDGDALGSTLSLKRGLEQLGQSVTLAMKVPRYLSFLCQAQEILDEAVALAPNTLLVLLDVSDKNRIWGADLSEAGYVINIDHHGSNDSFGDLAWVDSNIAAAAQMSKRLLKALNITWTQAIATPCLTGILTDTGFLRFGNTDKTVLHDVAELLDYGVLYTELTDRLQWRHPDYYRMLGLVMSTVSFPLEGKVAMVEMTEAMRQAIGETDDDSSDYVGQIRYAEGSYIAIFFREKGEDVKVSVRSRGDVSAQAICSSLGGGGHHAAAGITLRQTSLDRAKEMVLEAAKKELERHQL